MTMTLRIARPCSKLQRSATMYKAALGLDEVARFENHGGFDGVILALPGASWHLEFTHCRHHPVAPTPTAEDLLVFYVPDADRWLLRCNALLSSGFSECAAFNPYWQVNGRTFADPDGYRVVVQRAAWT